MKSVLFSAVGVLAFTATFAQGRTDFPMKPEMTEDNRSLIVDSLSTLIADEAVKNDTLLRAVVSSFYAGNEILS